MGDGKLAARREVPGRGATAEDCQPNAKAPKAQMPKANPPPTECADLGAVSKQADASADADRSNRHCAIGKQNADRERIIAAIKLSLVSIHSPAGRCQPPVRR